MNPLVAELGTGGGHVHRTDGKFGSRRECFLLSGLLCCLLVFCATTCGYFYVILLQASKAETAAALHQLQDKEKMLSAMKEEAAVAKEKCKQLSQVNTEVFMAIERSRGLED